GEPSNLPSFQRLTFRQGIVREARFAPDGRTVIYSASWGSEAPQVYLTRAESPESRPFGLADADVLAVSASGGLALRLRPTWPAWLTRGTLASMEVTGGAPRELMDGVVGADWAPDGARLAVARPVGGRSRLEFPIGKTLYESAERIDSPSVSPTGDAIAFVERNAVAVFDVATGKRTLATGWADRPRVAWSPNGQEIWFSATRVGWNDLLYAVTRTGVLRLVGQVPGSVELHDIARDGRVL